MKRRLHIPVITAMLLLTAVLQGCGAGREAAAVTEVTEQTTPETASEEIVITQTTAMPEGSGETSGAEASETESTPEAAPGADLNTDKQYQEVIINGAYSFGGYIGDSPVNLSFKLQENDGLEGEYSYTKYNTPIALSGEREGEYLRLRMYSEDFELFEYFHLFWGSDHVLRGLWVQDEKVHPVYLVPMKPGDPLPAKSDLPTAKELEDISGRWYGSGSDYFVHVALDVVPISDQLVYFDLEARNGANSGSLMGIGTYSDGVIRYTEQGNYFNFDISGGQTITLDTNDYRYSCGNGVSFADTYERRPGGLPIPDTLGFLTAEENQEIKRITGDYYEEIVLLAALHNQELFDMDGIETRIITYGMRGYMNAGVLVIQDTTGYMAATGVVYHEESMNFEYLYFTNEPNRDVPEPIVQWFGEREYAIVGPSD